MQIPGQRGLVSGELGVLDPITAGVLPKIGTRVNIGVHRGHDFLRNFRLWK